MDTKNAGVIALALIAGLLVGAMGTYALLEYSVKVPSTATVKAVNVGVYGNANCSVDLTKTGINWGVLQPGQVENFSAYVKNLSNVPITLSMYTQAWNPVNASNYITLTWNYSGQQLAVGAVSPVTFTLNVSSAVTGIETFSFTIFVVGSG